MNTQDALDSLVETILDVALEERRDEARITIRDLIYKHVHTSGTSLSESAKVLDVTARRDGQKRIGTHLVTCACVRVAPDGQWIGNPALCDYKQRQKEICGDETHKGYGLTGCVDCDWESERKSERVWVTWDDRYAWDTAETGGDEYVRVDLLDAALDKIETQATVESPYRCPKCGDDAVNLATLPDVSIGCLHCGWEAVTVEVKDESDPVYPPRIWLRQTHEDNGWQFGYYCDKPQDDATFEYVRVGKHST